MCSNKLISNKSNLIKYFFLVLFIILFIPTASEVKSIEESPIEKDISAKIWRLLGFFSTDKSNNSQRNLKLTSTNKFKEINLTANFDDKLNTCPLEIVIEENNLKNVITFKNQNLCLLNFNEELLQLLPKIDEILVRLDENKNFNYLEQINWITLDDGLFYTKAKANYGIRFGSPYITILKFDPKIYNLTPYYFKENTDWQNSNIKMWSKHLPKALAIINGGQYYPDNSYIGLLKKDGNYLESTKHKTWQGFIASGDKSEQMLTTIIDTSKDKADDIDKYPHLVQSYMLLDDTGKIRVKNSHNLTSRSIIAENKSGEIFLIHIEGAISLYDTAVILKKSNLDISKALGLDGGFEAQLYYKDQNKDPVIKTAEYSVRLSRFLHLSNYTPSLPCVLALEVKN